MFGAFTLMLIYRHHSTICNVRCWAIMCSGAIRNLGEIAPEPLRLEFTTDSEVRETCSSAENAPSLPPHSIP
jgi:hypothetical protein